jgi:hypothetical protein
MTSVSSVNVVLTVLVDLGLITQEQAEKEREDWCRAFDDTQWRMELSKLAWQNRPWREKVGRSDLYWRLAWVEQSRDARL